MEKIIIGSDHAGFKLKEEVKKYLEKKGLRVEDAGTYSEERCDYPRYAAAVAEKVSVGKFKRGILICMTGIGNSIVANRFPGVRASLCCNIKAARLTREHNDSNILVLGAAFIDRRLAGRIVQVWLRTPFSGGRHARRLNLIKKVEHMIRSKKR
ncbi:MAG: ribose 5-phosphate isomerase B [Candidatus Omnitrophica bacterium]|nr:ribose 5-phosphate isomerase B [Candidatus Omnitrophota bacterium]